MRSHALFAAWILVTALAAACTQDNEFFVDPGTAGPCETGRLVIESFDLADPTAVDILFVVDNSGGMATVQTALRDAMPAFVAALNNIAGLDYQLGVTSTDIVQASQQGRLQTGMANQVGCPGERPAIVTRTTPSGASVAACNVVLGEGGDDFEAGLEAVRYALLGPAAAPNGPNATFLRPDARLVVIVVSNEDDCSDSGVLDRSNPSNCVWDRNDLIPLEPTYIGDQGFFIRIKTNAGQPVDLVTLVGPDDGTLYQRPEAPQPVCTANGPAFSGRRYHAVVDALGERGGSYNLCTRSYTATLEAIVAEHIAPRPETVCPFLTLTQEPVSVRRLNGVDVTPVSNDATGYLYLGQAPGCAQGQLQVAPDQFGLSVDERLEVHYCTADAIPE